VPLHLADVTFPDWHPLHDGTGAVLAFALRHPTGLLLFETGIGTGNQFIDDLYQVQQRAIDAALAAHGHDVNEVRLIVNSHLHFDHCGNNSRFPGVPIYVQAAEYQATREPYYTVPEWVDFDGAEYAADVDTIMGRMDQNNYNGDGLPAAQRGGEPTASLTAREREILELVDEGLSNKQIAKRLSIEMPTVKNHVHNILEKLDVRSRHEAAALLRERANATSRYAEALRI